MTFSDKRSAANCEAFLLICCIYAHAEEHDIEAYSVCNQSNSRCVSFSQSRTPVSCTPNVGRRGAVSGKALNRDATCGNARGYCRHPSEDTRYVAQEADGRQRDANSRRRLCVVRTHELTKAPSKPGKTTFQWRNRVAATLDRCFRASFI